MTLMDSDWVRRKARMQEYDLSSHAHRERQEEQITVREIEQILLKGAIIERYPNDLRGQSCLVAGSVARKSLHVVCGTRGERLLVITVYRPKLPVWINTTTRAKELQSRE